MSAHHSIRSHSPLKSVFGKIGDTYQSYCNTYKMNTMATCHGGMGHPLDRDINLNKENLENAETEIENTHDFDATVALNEPEETGHPQGPEYNTHMKLATLTRDLDDLCQCVQDGLVQPTDNLDCIEHELQKLAITICTPTPMEPLKEVTQHYTNTL